MTNDSAIQRPALEPGTHLELLHRLPNAGETVVIYSRGRFREAAVIKRGRTRVQTAYRSVSSGTLTTPHAAIGRLWRIGTDAGAEQFRIIAPALETSGLPRGSRPGSAGHALRSCSTGEVVRV
jgi:hypothetical protein